MAGELVAPGPCGYVENDRGEMLSMEQAEVNEILQRGEDLLIQEEEREKRGGPQIRAPSNLKQWRGVTVGKRPLDHEVPRSLYLFTMQHRRVELS